MTSLVAFLAGFACGIAACLWAIGRSMATALTPQPEPEVELDDPYLRDLAAILEREQL